MAWIQAITDGPGYPSVRNWEKNESLNELPTWTVLLAGSHGTGFKGRVLGKLSLPNRWVINSEGIRGTAPGFS